MVKAGRGKGDRGICSLGCHQFRWGPKSQHKAAPSFVSSGLMIILDARLRPLRARSFSRRELGEKELATGVFATWFPSCARAGGGPGTINYSVPGASVCSRATARASGQNVAGAPTKLTPKHRSAANRAFRNLLGTEGPGPPFRFRTTNYFLP